MTQVEAYQRLKEINDCLENFWGLHSIPWTMREMVETDFCAAIDTLKGIILR